MSEMTIQVDKRERTGKGGSRESRRKGMIPGVVYGGGKDSVPIELDRKTFVEMMKKSGNENPIFLLKLSDSGQERHAMLRDLQKDPVSRDGHPLDFQRIEMNQKVHVTVTVELVGTAVGVKTEGGLIEFTTRELKVECLPGDIPKHIEVDITDAARRPAHRGGRRDSCREGVTLNDDPEKVIVTLGHPRTEEATGEGDRAEPEVIKRGKTRGGLRPGPHARPGSGEPRRGVPRDPPQRGLPGGRGARPPLGGLRRPPGVQLSGRVGGVDGRPWLARPQTYMNRSGYAARCLLERYGLDPAESWWSTTRSTCRSAGCACAGRGAPPATAASNRSWRTCAPTRSPGCASASPRRPDRRRERTCADFVLAPFAADERETVDGDDPARRRRLRGLGGGGGGGGDEPVQRVRAVSCLFPDLRIIRRP